MWKWIGALSILAIGLYFSWRLAPRKINRTILEDQDGEGE